jgi:hypothetical protein
MKASSVALAVALALAARDVVAEEPALPRGEDLARGARLAALLDGTWSTVNQYESILADRGLYSSAWASSLASYGAQHLLYSTAWTALVVGESAGAALASDSFAWIGSATYRSEWLVALAHPDCPHIGARGGCGLGTGDFAYLELRPRRTRWWLEVGGGSFDQRILDDGLREVGETTWVLTPVTALYEIATPEDSPIAIDAKLGPGIFGGALNATMEPTTRGRDVFRNRPWTGLYPRYGGLGPGARAEVSLVALRHLVIDGDFVLAPFLLGGASHVSSDVAPLATPPSGFPTWRQLTVGIGYRDPATIPFTPHVELFAAELSNRTLEHAAYRGVMMRFDIPLREGSGMAAAQE